MQHPCGHLRPPRKSSAGSQSSQGLRPPQVKSFHEQSNFLFPSQHLGNSVRYVTAQVRAELPRDRRKTTGWGCGHPQPRPSRPAQSSAGAWPAQEAGPPAPRLPPTDRGTREWSPGQGSERGEVRGGSFSSLLQLNPLPSNVTKHPGPSDKPHRETGNLETVVSSQVWAKTSKTRIPFLPESSFSLCPWP